MKPNKYHMVTFQGSVCTVQKEFNNWIPGYDNIEIVQFIPKINYSIQELTLIVLYRVGDRDISDIACEETIRAIAEDVNCMATALSLGGCSRCTNMGSILRKDITALRELFKLEKYSDK